MLANDTSVGVGHAPLSRLERLVLAVEKRINARDRARQNPAWGEDVKVMGVRHGEAVNLTIACAMIGRHLAHIDDYLAEKDAVAELGRGLAIEHGFATCDVVVNAADKPAAGSVYLTVTGTSHRRQSRQAAESAARAAAERRGVTRLAAHFTTVHAMSSHPLNVMSQFLK